jgi:RNA polymerase sigma-70 factor (ECF subfamily)
MEEQKAVARLKQGDLAGLEALVERYQAPAVHAAYLVVADRALAEDIVQTAFLKAAGKISQFDPRRPFRPWFLRIVINDSIKAARRGTRTLSLDQAPQAILEWLTDPDPGPEQLAEEGELRREIWNALRQLSPEQRSAIVQRHFLDMSEDEMAEALARPASTVRWWLHAGRKRLRDVLSSKPGSNSKGRV